MDTQSSRSTKNSATANCATADPTISNPALGSHRQLLLRCTVTNRQSEHSVRFIEQSLYPLWEHLVTTRHGISIQATQPCLWVPDSDIQTRSLFRSDHRVNTVSRLHLQTYNPQNHITTHQQRFIAHDVLEIVLPLLQQHWSENQANQHLRVEAGDVYLRSGYQHAA